MQIASNSAMLLRNGNQIGICSTSIRNSTTDWQIESFFGRNVGLYARNIPRKLH